MAKIFISFIHEEENLAKLVQEFIQVELGWEANAFLSSDPWQVYGGEIWLDRIKEELKTAEVIILMLSPASIGRPWVNFEAGAAWLTGKVLIPVCYGGLEKGNLPHPYSGIQSLSLKGERNYLIASIRHHLKILPDLPPPLDDQRERDANIPTPPPLGREVQNIMEDIDCELNKIEKMNS